MKLFPDHIRKIGLFPLSLGTQGEEYLPTALKRLSDWGVEYVCPEPQGPQLRYMAASDQERARIFNTLLANEEIDLLFAIRGGFGAARALPYIDWDLLLKRNIPVVGYSDMTAFLLAAWKKGFTNAISGVMAESSFGDPKSTAEKLEQGASALHRCVAGETIATPFPPDFTGLRTGSVTAPVVPANQMLLASLIGTPWQPDLTGVILVLEGINEDAITVDRYLTQLKGTGMLEKLAGLVFGTFTNCAQEQYLPEIFREYAALVPGPSCYGMPFGHEFPASAIHVGHQATLTVTDGKNVEFH